VSIATALFPASALAATQWSYGGPKAQERQPIRKGVWKELPVAGTLYFRLHVPLHGGIRITCTTTGRMAFSNSEANGLDQTRALAFSCTAECGAVTLKARELPWPSILTGTEIPLRDEWSGVALAVTCGATHYGTFTGSLAGWAGDKDPNGENGGESGPDEPDSELRLKGSDGYPVLHGRNESTLAAVGILKVGIAGKEVVVAELHP